MGAGNVWPGEEEAQEHLALDTFLKGARSQVGVGLFYQVTNGRMNANGQAMASSCAAGGLDV